MKKRMIVISLVAFLLAMTALVFPTGKTNKAYAANAAHCTSLGNLIESDNIMAGSTKVGELDIYYNSSTGYNCAYTQSSSSNWGVAKYMEVSIGTCVETSPSPSCHLAGQQFDLDDGTFSYYAGPVGVYGKGHCISAAGSVYGSYLLNQPYWYSTGASHCG